VSPGGLQHAFLFEPRGMRVEIDRELIVAPSATSSAALLEEGLSFKNVHTFNLDEYYPMQPEALQSYVRFMREHLFDHIDVPKKNIAIGKVYKNHNWENFMMGRSR